MRFLLCCGCLAVISIAAAQDATKAPAPAKKLELRGDRFRGLTYEELTPEQRESDPVICGYEFTLSDSC